MKKAVAISTAASCLLIIAWWYIAIYEPAPPNRRPAPEQYRRLSPEQLDSLWLESVRQSGEPVLI